MGMGCQRAAFLAERGPVINQERGFAVDDRARILHCAIGKVRRRDQVELGVGIWIVEILFLNFEHCEGRLMRGFQLSGLACSRKRSERNIPVADGIGRNGAI